MTAQSRSRAWRHTGARYLLGGGWIMVVSCAVLAAWTGGWLAVRDGFITLPDRE
jgi:hypothetical protein